MIINDEYKFCFVHIPKCAGTAVRNSLQRFDDLQGKHTARVDRHETLGPLDYVHVPLAVLESHFPVEYEKVEQYRTFAVVRDPYSRFPSSLSQRLKKHAEKPMREMTQRELHRALDDVMRFLSANDGEDVLPPEYIHFQKQHTYVAHRGKRLVDHLYTTSEVSVLISDISKVVGERLAPDDQSTPIYANKSVVYRSDFVKGCSSLLRPLFSTPANSLMPASLKAAIRSYMYVPRDSKLQGVFSSDNVQSFIAEYYAKDIELYAAVSGDSNV